jgi:N-methylhydantoinase B
MIEAELPLRVRRYAFVPDSGGPGKFRGGLALTREYEVLADEATMTIRTDRRTHPPYGLAGGQRGTPSLTEINPGRDRARVLPVLPMEDVQLRKGDVIRHVQAGGGGYGDAFARDPLAVLEDVLDQKLTVAYARQHYGVVIDATTGTLDLEATARARSAPASNGVTYA